MVDRRRAVEAVSALAREIVTGFELAGLAVGVVRDGEAVYANGFGVKSLETGEPITPDSMFRVASVTKPFVATAVMQLVEEGAVQLDAPVVEFLPYFRLNDERYAQITVRHLLNHTSGLPRSFEEPEADDDRERYIRRNAGVRLSASPGNQFGYSNLGYEVLGEVVARVSGLRFEDYVESRVLAPVHMHASTLRSERVDARLEALPHLNGPHPILGPAVPQHSVHAPSGGLVSSAREMCNWAIANLNEGRFRGGRIVEARSYGELWNRSGPSQDESAAGLGWFFGEHRGHHTVQHGGSTTGYESCLILVPDWEAAVVVLTNSYPVPKGGIALALLDAVLGHTPERPRPLVLHQIYPTLIHEGRRAAIAQYEALKVDHPDDYDFGSAQFYQIGWANLLSALKKPNEAIEVIELAVAIHPESDAYHHVLALAYDECDETAQAIRSLKRCLALNPAHQGASDMLTRLRREKEQT